MKGLHHQVEKNIGIRKLEFGMAQFFYQCYN